MFYKRCGNLINPDDTACPVCGYPVLREDGNSFWDLAEKPDSHNPVSIAYNAVHYTSPRSSSNSNHQYPDCSQVPSTRSADPSRNAKGKGSAKKRSANGGNICMALCLSLLFIVLLAVFRDTHKLQHEISDLNTSIADLQHYIVSSTTNDDTKPTVSVKPDVTLNIEGPPESPPIVGSSDQVLLTCTVTGMPNQITVDTFEWEKLEGGKWCPLDFSEDNVDLHYGLESCESIEDRCCSLKSRKLTSDASGTYRCKVTYLNEMKFSASVELIIE